MKALIVIGYIVAATIYIGLTVWIMRWCAARTVAAFRSVFGKK